jgi:uncharacterized SAM-binding protein YcdF (DUF218 family)
MLLGSATVLWTARAPVLRRLAAVWTISDSLTYADAVVVLGGGTDTRPFAAAELYKRGLTHRILVADVKISPVQKVAVGMGDTDLSRDVLLKLGVPAAAISTFGNRVTNTYDESRALYDWVQANAATHVIIPTEIFSTRRIHWIFNRRLASLGVRASVSALVPIDYIVDDWWRHERGIIQFQNEVAKYVYYRFKY